MATHQMLIQEPLWWVPQITASLRFGDYHRLLAPGKSYEGECPRLIFQSSGCVHKMMITRTSWTTIFLQSDFISRLAHSRMV
jgi:hypothetical protein